MLLGGILSFLEVENEYLCDIEPTWHDMLKPYANFEDYDANPDDFHLNPVQMIEEAMDEDDWGEQFDEHANGKSRYTALRLILVLGIASPPRRD